MKKSELNSLLHKYYNGDTTIEEEKALQAYFSSDDIPEGYEAEKAIFRYYYSESSLTEPAADFENRILSAIDKVENERITHNIPVRRMILTSLSIAAGILIIAGIWFLFIQDDQNKDTYTDPQIAYAETMKILFSVSSRMNEAERALQPVSEMTELPAESLKTVKRSTDIVGRTLENLESLADKKQTHENVHE